MSRFKYPFDSVPLNCAEWHNLSATLRLIIVYEAGPCSLCSTTARSLFERERWREATGWVYVPELINLQPLRLCNRSTPLSFSRFESTERASHFVLDSRSRNSITHFLHLPPTIPTLSSPFPALAFLCRPLFLSRVRYFVRFPVLTHDPTTPFGTVITYAVSTIRQPPPARTFP